MNAVDCYFRLYHQSFMRMHATMRSAYRLYYTEANRQAVAEGLGTLQEECGIVKSITLIEETLDHHGLLDTAPPDELFNLYSRQLAHLQDDHPEHAAILQRVMSDPRFSMVSDQLETCLNDALRLVPQGEG